MAWFNLENSFGSPEDADECLKEALKCNDSYKVYAQAAAVYEQQPGKVKEIILHWNLKKSCNFDFCRSPRQKSCTRLWHESFARSPKPGLFWASITL